MKKKEYYIYKIISEYDDDLGATTQKWRMVGRAAQRDDAINLARDFIVDAADKNLRAVEVVCRFYDDLRRQGCSRVVWATRNRNNMGSLFAGLQRIIGQKARKYSDAA
ncbi:MAG: hypothetical protein CL561_02110 [Alphaproteobacteria bacterium]|nr:hypothetical protein [Alphaproteobacteria bacterium]|tara:strand:- start:2040 stop:2363 length:324 start_codon:yes stop_codon:yes gene_type:complete